MNIVFFEGIDGAGKTTLVANYHEYLNQSGKNSEIVKFPQDDKIREVCRGYSNSTAKVLLFFSDMKNWWDKPKEEGKIYLVDRFYTTTWVYQVLLQKYLNPDKMTSSKGIFNFLKHDLFWLNDPSVLSTVWVKASPEVCMERMLIRKSKDDEEDLTMLTFLDKCYHDIFSTTNHVLINGEQNERDMLNNLIERLAL